LQYVIDTSALVDAWTKWYSPRTIPSFWINIEYLGKEKILGIPDGVILELQVIEDDLYKWCKEREDIMSIISTDEIQALIKKIANEYPNLRNSSKAKKNFADPIVIAAAEYHKCSVVTHESPTGTINGPRIPDVCKDKGLRVLQIHHLVKDQGWVFN